MASQADRLAERVVGPSAFRGRTGRWARHFMAGIGEDPIGSPCARHEMAGLLSLGPTCTPAALRRAFAWS